MQEERGVVFIGRRVARSLGEYFLMIDKEMESLAVEISEYIRNRYFGKYRGLVREVGENDRLGYIKAKVPAVYGENIDSPWALPSVPFAGNSHGLVAIPEVGDGVWIEFEAGDPSRPIWTGFWWADGEIPQDSGPTTRVWITTGGHKLILDDEGDKVQLFHSGGAEITMASNEITIKAGRGKIVLSSSGVSINDTALEVR